MEIFIPNTIQEAMCASYPDVQKAYIVYRHNTIIPFFELLTKVLISDKLSRRSRMVWYSHNTLGEEHNKFAVDIPTLNEEELKVIENAMRKLDEVPVTDPLFVEKTYYMLSELTHWAKYQGGQEVCRYLNDFPELKNNFPDYFLSTLETGHSKFDLDFALFEDPEHVDFKNMVTYCNQYRKECYEVAETLFGEFGNTPKT